MRLPRHVSRPGQSVVRRLFLALSLFVAPATPAPLEPGDSAVLVSILRANGLRDTVPIGYFGFDTITGRVNYLKLRQDTAIKTIPPEIGRLTGLDYLRIRKTSIRGLPAEIGLLTSLARLELDSNMLECLPEEIGSLRNLLCLWVNGNRLSHLPRSLCNLHSLGVLYAHNNRLTELPDGFCRLSKLEILYLTDNRLRAVPEDIGQMSGLRQLVLADNMLTTLPSTVVKLNVRTGVMHWDGVGGGGAEKLWPIHVQNNRLCSLPQAISQFLDSTAANWRATQQCAAEATGRKK
jgi:Leucine-rich repeat (LRR) protein